MNSSSDNIHAVRTYSSRYAFVRHIPTACALILLGLFIISADDASRPLVAAFILVLAGSVLIAMAIWHFVAPVDPILALSPLGIRYRISSRHIVVIPWDDVAGVTSADMHVFHRGFVFVERAVPVVLVSNEFYQSRIHLGSLWSRGPFWNSRFIRKGPLVQIALYPKFFGQTAACLRASIEMRWRAFSEHENAKGPLQPHPPEARSWVSPRQRWVLGITAGIALIPVLWYWQLVTAWLKSDIPEGSQRGYIQRLLDGPGLPARSGSGRMVIIARTDGPHIKGTACRKEIARRQAAPLEIPVYDVSWDCQADLRLPTGEQVVGAFRLIIEDHVQKHYDGTDERVRVVSTAPLSLAEAERMICEARTC